MPVACHVFDVWPGQERIFERAQECRTRTGARSKTRRGGTGNVSTTQTIELLLVCHGLCQCVATDSRVGGAASDSP